jgi:DNA primase
MTCPASKFDRSALPPARSYYERELGQFRRASRGWAAPKAGCPFHESRSKTSFRVNFDSGAFRCFGCGAHGGDVLAFMMQRYKLSFKEAAEKLGAWSNSPSPDWKRLRAERQRAEQTAQLRKQQERSERIRARDHLHTLERRYAEATAARDVDLLSTLLPVIRQAEEAYWTLAGMEVRHEQ